MEIKKNGSQPSAKGPAAYFTGSVRIDSPFKGEGLARVGGAIVSFEPGVRTAWHTHPLGQTLIVIAGRGWAQCEGGPIEEIQPGDIVGSSRAKSIGTGHRQSQQWPTSPLRRRSRTRSSSGWSKSGTSNTKRDHCTISQQRKNNEEAQTRKQQS
jgi:hypothetical protein